jgi:NADH:ubiquinone oxidoreductase subunit F (NADH-binding)/NADH:ubiquinone oxidoreductase subunit E
MSSLKTIYHPINIEIETLTEEHHKDPGATLEILQQLQERHGWLSPETITDVARALQLPYRQVYGLASFYSMLSLEPHKKKIIHLCDGPVCWLNRAKTIKDKLNESLAANDQWGIERTSCLGLCDRAPAALVESIQTGPLSEDHLSEIQHGWQGEKTDYSTTRDGETRVMLSRLGLINPDSIESAIANGGYQGLLKAFSLTSEEVIETIENSGLTGRGGAGFPVGRKMRFVAHAPSNQKYVICNADESEPLIFKDRVLIDTNPHQLLEGIIIAGYATGASEAYIYIRGEYHLQAQRLGLAIQQAKDKGYLGQNIRGKGFSFNIHIHRGAGAYICGEETALIESLEGKRGEPRLRPPYPPSYGYRGQPTLVNNVESLSALPAIIENGPDWYHSFNPDSTPGTKIYMVLGHVKKPGLFEAPFGLTLKRIVEQFGGGMLPGSEFKFALTGGAAGTLVPPELMDIPIDYSSAAKGVSLGAGAFLVCDQNISPVNMLRELLHFFTSESCGKCTPCRQGTTRSLSIVDRMLVGGGKVSDIDELLRYADILQYDSFCGLGQSVAIPIKSALHYFREDFVAFIA